MQIEEITKSENKAAILVDSGSLLFKHDKISPSNLMQEKISAKAIVQSMLAMGYQTAGIASRDLAAGVDYLLTLQKETGFQWLSLNIMDKTGQNSIFPALHHMEVNGIRIVLIGVTEVIKTLPGAHEFQIVDWKKPLSNLLDSLSGKADMVILLSSLPDDVNKQIAKDFDNIHIIFQSGNAHANKQVEEINNTLICQIGNRGKYLGVMKIDWNKSGRWGTSFAEQEKELMNQLDRINWQIARKEKRLSKEELSSDKKYPELLESRNDLEKRIEKRKTKKNNDDALCSYENRFIALKTSMPESDSIKLIIDNAKMKINKINRRQFRSEKISYKDSEMDKTLSTLSGWRSCNRCHPDQTTFWKTTKHSRAWQTLIDNDQQYNPQCMSCHLTLPSYSLEHQKLKEMFTDLMPELKTVGCESCHGPGKQHVSQPKQFRMKKTTRATCLQCHIPEHDNNFDFELKRNAIKCPI